MEASLVGPRVHGDGVVVVELLEREPGRYGWTVANVGGGSVRLRAVELVFRLEVAGSVRMFRNGYQSWSACGGAKFGVDADPSRAPGSRALARQVHHADAAATAPGELRSEQVTVLADATNQRVLVGFLAGRDHDGTLRLRERDGAIELVAEAYFGGAELAAGERRRLHDVVVRTGPQHDHLLASWATAVGAESGARARAPYQVGWCSWYHYFHDVTERDIRANLALADEWPFDVFQVDDGYQAAIGDWLVTNDKFPGPLERLAGNIAAAGRVAGIWLAPFLAHPDAPMVREHPEWIARSVDGGQPLVGMINPAWRGAVHVLDTTRPEVLAHIEATSAALVAMGWRYLKLDFTYAPGLDGTWADGAPTPAQRIRAGFEAVRRGAGDAFLLGCGAPLGPAVGIVDGMRIGPDVAPWWGPEANELQLPGYAEALPATLNAWRNTLCRSFMHRRLWLNDPDCLMLRTRDTRMSPDAAHAWALAVAASGGMALVSDDLKLLDGGSRARLDEVIATGREVDAASVASPPSCPDLLDEHTPRHLVSEVCTLVGDPETATATLTPN
jgi:alpha-galactosidase